MPDHGLSYAKIFPPIGVARVGNSPDQYFIGPEAPGIEPDPPGGYKDAAGRIKRQGARFRLFAFGADGKVNEITADHPAVERVKWTVTLANKKAEWFRFSGAKQVAAIWAGEQARRRNATVSGPDREGLKISSQAVSVSGAGQRSGSLTGQFALPGFLPKTVYLGELLTDEVGRLIVLGGRGESASLPEDNPLAHYANNDGWHDDTSDGPVVAEVWLKDGTQLEVRGSAWVVVAPPHFSPHTPNIVTLYDVMLQAALEHEIPWESGEMGRKPSVGDKPLFERDIYPILSRMSRYQWVSRRAHRGHAGGKRGDFLNSDVVSILAKPEEATKPESLHRRIFARIRTPLKHPLSAGLGTGTPLEPTSQEALDQANLSFMPALAGDEGDVRLSDVYPPVDDEGVTPPETWLTVTELQYHKLRRWKDGDFESAGASVPPVSFDAIPASERPLALTRAALEACQGGAFFPGIELTSTVRFQQLYSEAFRVDASIYTAGDLTKWMALPWQADFYECREHWWPSTRPDDVVPVGEYEDILEEFKEEAQEKRLASLLIVRKRWDRGLGLKLPDRPALPAPRRPTPSGDSSGEDVNLESPKNELTTADLVDAESADQYAERCKARLEAYSSVFLRIVPVPLDGEQGQPYVRRLEEFLAKTLVRIPPLPPVDPAGSLDDYRARVVAELTIFLQKEGSGAVPAPAAGESLADYAARVDGIAAGRSVWQGLFDVEWRRRVLNRGKNDLVKFWHRLGFVVPREKHGETVYVEADRDRFALISFREAFYYLMNIESHPEFLPKARELAREYIDEARRIEREFIAVTPAYEQYRSFKYDPVTFQARLEKIYELERIAGENYNPATGVGEGLFRTPAQVVERIRQLAPFNQLDGGWLERAVKTGPIDDIRAFLFEIWSDEIGNGDPAQNHANIYTGLMHSAGLYFPPIPSRAYSEHPDLWEASFSSPAYQAAIAQFPEAFFPEILGMTLYLEWEAVYLPAMVKLYEYHGYNPLFYRLHVAIDNPVNGHGARARDAVMRYLDRVAEDAGPIAMEEHWQRIWSGYLAFKFVGGEEWVYRFTNPPDVEERIQDVVLAKRHYGQLNHGLRRLGANSINDLFDEPDQFLELLANSDLVVRGDATQSPFFRLLSPTGPMLKVFTTQDRTLWAEWINSLPKDPVGGALAPGNAMRVLLEEFRARGSAVPDHGSYALTGTVQDIQTGQPRTVTKPVSWWFQVAQPENFMLALANPDNGWIIPGQVDRSRLVTELLSDTGRMARFLSFTVPELGDRPARAIIIDWISAGCPAPEATVTREIARATPRATGETLLKHPARLRLASSSCRSHDSEAYVREMTRRTVDARPLSAEQRLGIRPRYGPGGGAAH